MMELLRLMKNKNDADIFLDAVFVPMQIAFIFLLSIIVWRAEALLVFGFFTPSPRSLLALTILSMIVVFFRSQEERSFFNAAQLFKKYGVSLLIIFVPAALSTLSMFWFFLSVDSTYSVDLINVLVFITVIPILRTLVMTFFK